MKIVVFELKPQGCFMEGYDNLTNYDEEKVMSNAGVKVDDKTKKHPLECEIIKAEVETFNEDVVSAIFFGERDETKKTPTAAFNGFYTTLDLLKTAGYISAAEGNLQTTGAIVNTEEKPSDAFDKTAVFIRKAHSSLRNAKNVMLIVSNTVVANLLDGYKAKCKSFGDPTMAQMTQALRDASMCQGLEIGTHSCLGTVSKMILVVPGIMDLGRNEGNGGQFCQVRDVATDPNEGQFWIPDGVDTRMQELSAKLF